MTIKTYLGCLVDSDRLLVCCRVTQGRWEVARVGIRSLNQKPHVPLAVHINNFFSFLHTTKYIYLHINTYHNSDLKQGPACFILSTLTHNNSLACTVFSLGGFSFSPFYPYSKLVMKIRLRENDWAKVSMAE